MSGKAKQPRDIPRGGMVELVRLILVALFAVGGWQIADAIGDARDQLLLGIVLGSAIGYVVGGVLGRRTVVVVSEVERQFRRTPAVELLGGAIGLILGLVISVLASVLLFRLPPQAAAPTAAFVSLLLCYLGYRVGRGKAQDLFGLFGLKPRASGSSPGSVNVLDTSALIDGRIHDVVRAGFLGGTFLVPLGVLNELQQIADSSDPQRRSRGQRGLEVLRELQVSPHVDVALVEEEPAPGQDVDAMLVRLAKDRGGAVVTSDSNLASVAGALDVPVRSMRELAASLRPSVLPGEAVTVKVTREGREHGQGVGFLEDGTMVVVEGGRKHLGSDLQVTVTNVLQTASGRMVFARTSGEAS